MAKLIIGCGYVGARLARYWTQQGEEVWATTRNEQRAQEFREAGLHPLLLDVTDFNATSLTDVGPSKFDTVVFAVGFDRSSDHKIEEVYVGGLRNVLDGLPDGVKQFVYLSSTGVYGQIDGGWVDEESLCQPFRDGGKACLAAEELLREHPRTQSNYVILRLAGIYGPERLPQVDSLKRGEALRVAANGFLNLIHVDDIVQIVAQLEGLAALAKTFCVSDGCPVVRADFYNYLSELLGTEAPTFAAPAPDSPRAARARGSKRIRNDLLMKTIGPKLLYPSYREGVEAIVNGLSGGKNTAL